MPIAQSVSFDCGKAQSTVEHAICDSPTLSKFDDELSDLYSKAQDIDENNGLLQSEQVSWLVHDRNICKDTACLEHTYKNRINALSKYIDSPHQQRSVLVFSTYLGGRSNDRATRIRVDAAGNSYVGGFTEAWDDFPVLNATQPKRGGRKDGIVAKFSNSGALLWATHLGGTKNKFDFTNFEASTEITGLALDATGHIYVAGDTDATDFPIAHATQSELQGSRSSFLVKYSEEGHIIWSTYINELYVRDIATDRNGAVYLAASKLRPNKGGIAVIIKYDDLGKPVWEREFGGGEHNTDVWHIALDGDGNIYLGGEAQIDSLPNPRAAPQYAKGQAWNPFIAKFDRKGELLWSTVIGGEKKDWLSGIGVDSENNIYAVGSTTSREFPILKAVQPSRPGKEDGFVAKFSTDGKLLWSTYLGSTGDDSALSVAIDHKGYVHVTGYTASTNFPTKSSFQRRKAGLTNAFITTYSTDGKLVRSSYLGGKSPDYHPDMGRSVATDGNANVYIVGSTGSEDFPTKNPYQISAGGLDDMFVTNIEALQ
jgi:uncharacterized protein YecT (DUF1311 family)